MNRRAWLRTAGGILAAPAVVRAESIMRVRALALPRPLLLLADGEPGWEYALSFYTRHHKVKGGGWALGVFAAKADERGRVYMPPDVGPEIVRPTLTRGGLRGPTGGPLTMDGYNLLPNSQQLERYVDPRPR